LAHFSTPVRGCGDRCRGRIRRPRGASDRLERRSPPRAAELSARRAADAAAAPPGQPQWTLPADQLAVRPDRAGSDPRRRGPERAGNGPREAGPRGGGAWPRAAAPRKAEGPPRARTHAALAP